MPESGSKPSFARAVGLAALALTLLTLMAWCPASAQGTDAGDPGSSGPRERCADRGCDRFGAQHVDRVRELHALHGRRVLRVRAATARRALRRDRPPRGIRAGHEDGLPADVRCARSCRLHARRANHDARAGGRERGHGGAVSPAAWRQHADRRDDHERPAGGRTQLHRSRFAGADGRKRVLDRRGEGHVHRRAHRRHAGEEHVAGRRARSRTVHDLNGSDP